LNKRRYGGKEEERAHVIAPVNGGVPAAGDAVAGVACDAQGCLEALEVFDAIVNSAGFSEVPVLASNRDAERRKGLAGFSKTTQHWKGGDANLVTLLLVLSNSGSIKLNIRMTSLECSPDLLWLLVSTSQLKKKSEGKTKERKFQRQSLAVL
jgi:hypothetical protein